MDSKMNVLSAVNEMRKVVEGVNKEKKAGMMFETVSYDGLLEMIRDTAIEHGLMLVPHKCNQTNCTPYDVKRWDSKANGFKEVRQNCDSYVFDFRLYHVSGEYLDISVPSVGIDPDDKGPGKATTYASKNAWMQVLMLKRGKNFEVDLAPEEDRSAQQQKAYEENRQRKIETKPETKLPQWTADPKTWPENWQKIYSDLLADAKNEQKLEDMESVNWVKFMGNVDAGLNKGSCPTVIAATITRGACVHLLATLIKTRHAPATAELVEQNADLLKKYVGEQVFEQIMAKVKDITPF